MVARGPRRRALDDEQTVAEEEPPAPHEGGESAVGAATGAQVVRIGKGKVLLVAREADVERVAPHLSRQGGDRAVAAAHVLKGLPCWHPPHQHKVSARKDQAYERQEVVVCGRLIHDAALPLALQPRRDNLEVGGRRSAEGRRVEVRREVIGGEVVEPLTG